jgi:hypothetical protein
MPILDWLTSNFLLKITGQYQNIFTGFSSKKDFLDIPERRETMT